MTGETRYQRVAREQRERQEAREKRQKTEQRAARRALAPEALLLWQDLLSAHIDRAAISLVIDLGWFSDVRV
jgi:hypothetical protein